MTLGVGSLTDPVSAFAEPSGARGESGDWLRAWDSVLGGREWGHRDPGR